jgi:gas vesicle protein GvpL/GvpF
MGWYVFALVDRMPSGPAGKGLTGALSVRKLAGALVIVERRADVPPVEFGSLKRHQDVVARLAARVPAILPVRFGTLLESEHLEEAVQERDDEIAEALDLVRGRVQFTWRQARLPRRSAPAGAGAKAGGARSGLPTSGAEYLRQAARAANPAPPAAFRPLRTKLARLIAAQRYQPGTAGLPEAVYHLVEQKRADRYVTAAAALTKARPALIVTGPFAPFAFAPEIL